MITGKIPYLEAVNGSTVLLPCKYASCVGIKDLYFRWSFNDTDPANKVRTCFLVSASITHGTSASSVRSLNRRVTNKTIVPTDYKYFSQLLWVYVDMTHNGMQWGLDVRHYNAHFEGFFTFDYWLFWVGSVKSEIVNRKVNGPSPWGVTPMSKAFKCKTCWKKLLKSIKIKKSMKETCKSIKHLQN